MLGFFFQDEKIDQLIRQRYYNNSVQKQKQNKMQTPAVKQSHFALLQLNYYFTHPFHSQTFHNKIELLILKETPK